jgi:hypothetical protein
MYLIVGSPADLVTGDPEMRAEVHRWNADGTGTREGFVAGSDTPLLQWHQEPRCSHQRPVRLPVSDQPAKHQVGRWEGREHEPNRTVFAAQGTPGKDRATMLRTPQYEFTRYDDGGGELYDLSRDPA